MKAATHTEIYRRFSGTLRPSALRFLPLASSGIRVAFKRKLALVLFLPPLIGTVIFSFVVYAKFSLEAGLSAGPIGQGNPNVSMIGAFAGQLIEVKNQIVMFILSMSFFSLLIFGWYGAGSIAEDRRLGAHLLYFSRPLTRLDYIAGKFLVVSAFGLAGMLLPGLVICAVAVFCSPHYSFLTEQGDVILHTILFSLVWNVVIGSLVLSISSLSSRKTFALVGTVGFFVLSQGIGVLLVNLQDDRSWMMIGPLSNLRRVAASIFHTKGIPGIRLDWSVSASWWALLFVVVLAWAITLYRVRRMEVVA